MFLLIDNYDSFTWNLWHYLGELGARVEVRRNDALSAAEALAMVSEGAAAGESAGGGIVLSPGPCDPPKAGVCLELVAAAAEAARAGAPVPVLGVCLGHQCIAEAFGARIVRAPEPKHGKTGEVTHDGSGVFTQLPRTFQATRYHSLTVSPENVPACLAVNARSEDGVIQGLRHKELPMHGVQFHPESIASEHGHALLRNFINLCRSPEHRPGGVGESRAA